MDGDAAEERPGSPVEAAGQPTGDVYTWYHRGVQLLENKDPAAAAQVLRRAHAAEPGSPSILEALARAEFDAGRYPDAEECFRRLSMREPTSDYARFGLGLALWRQGHIQAAAEHLSLATAMRPGLPHYAEALRQVRATLRAREAR